MLLLSKLNLPYVLAAGAVPHYFSELAALVVAGAIIAYISFRLKLVPIIGFLLAGVLIGPNALGLVSDLEIVDATAEIGVILLLFTIGIEFSLEKLAKIRRLIFGGGILQVGLSTGVVTGLLILFGVGWQAAVFTGLLVSLSSTAIVLKLLGESGETNSESGQVGLGLLIFQDLAIVMMVMLVPMLGTNASGGIFDIGWALLKAVLIIAAVLLIASRVMPKILEEVAMTCSPELFLLTVIAICFGTAYLTSLAGVSLSLGAFLAGLLVSESRFSHQALSETLPLQILFSATFFVSVGMLLDLSFFVQNLPLILAVIAVVLIIKIATTVIGVAALGYKLPVAAASGLMLAQIGEFSFVLEKTGREAGLSPAGLGTNGSQTFIASTVVLMVLTPFLMRIGNGLSKKIEKNIEQNSLPTAEEAQNIAQEIDLEDHVIVAGYGEAARYLVRILSSSNIPFVITTLSPTGANEADAENLPVMRGDSSKLHVLQLVNVNKAKMLVIADDDPGMAERITSVARVQNPTMRIVVRTRYTADVEKLARAGADVVIAEELESIVQLFGEVLHDYRIPAEEIEAHENLARKNGYAALIGINDEIDKTIFACEATRDCLKFRTVTIRSDMAISLQPLKTLKLTENYGINLESVLRNGQIYTEFSDDFIVQPGDELSLNGITDKFTRCAELFRPVKTDEKDDNGKFSASTVNKKDKRKITNEAQTGGLLSPTLKNKNYKIPEEISLIDKEKAVEFKPQTADLEKCPHLSEIRRVFPSAAGCEECLKTGDRWVHLRICLSCGHVGCCDSSPNKHATKHFHATTHPVIKSLEPGEEWGYCYVDDLMVERI